ncbi:MAG: hypothetical protein WCL16_11005, partial [bacterium]
MRSLINRFFSKAMLLAALGVTVGGAQAQFNMTLDVTPRAGVTATKGSIVLPTIVPPFTNKMEIASGAVPMVAVVSNGWRFVGWQLVAGDGAFDDSTQTNTTYYYNFQTSASIRAVFGESLTITSTNRDGALVGNPQPFGGASYDDPASSILTTNLVPFRLWVTTPWPLTATEQAICTGFKAAGILPATSILTSNSVSITTNTTIDWQWSSQYGMNVTTNPAGGGTVTRSNPGPWYNPGDTVTLTATPGFGYNFSGWSGDTNGATSLIVTPAVGTLTMVMNSGHAVLASFVSKSAVNLTIVSTVPAYGPVGAPQPWSGTQATNNGAYITASVTTPFSGGVIPAGIREMLVTPVSWTGTGSLPGSGAGNSATFTITNDTSVTWNWVEQYKLTINTNFAPGSGGYVTHTPAGAPGNDMWYTNGVTVIMQAFPDANSTIAGWGGTVDDSTLELTNSVVISGPPAQSVDINFVPKSSERMIWFANFGLNENAPPYSDRGLHGDPDGDGIDNQGEYLISMQAASNGIAIPSSPVHCDSDGDSMDDGYEFHYIINTNAPGQGGQQKNGIAVVWPNDNFGTNGNTDGDFHWSTTNGYLTTQPLINIEEYKGPDGVAPYNFESIAAGGVSSDGWTNSLSSRTVVRRVVNPADSADTSFSDTRFTSGDSMDDGFKWSWDTWQKNNAGMLIAGTNWTAITNTVPSWTQVRIFKPSVIFLEPDAYGFPRGYPAYDVWYNPDDGQRLDNYVTIMQKYQASALSSSNQYPVLRRYPPPFSPSWCVNPFLWDTDNDGLPDGWELTFGYDPWDRTTKGVTLPDGKGNPAGAWYAKDDGGRRHNQVYLQPKTPDGHLYDPNTGYGYAVPLAAAGPDTVEFDNLER